MGWIEWKSGDGNHFWFFIISLSRALMNSPKYIPKNNKKNEIRNFLPSLLLLLLLLRVLLSIVVAVHNIIVVPSIRGRKIASVSIFNEWSNYVWLIIIHVTPSAVAPLSSYSQLAIRIERRSEVVVVSHNNLIFIARHYCAFQPTMKRKRWNENMCNIKTWHVWWSFRKK